MIRVRVELVPFSMESMVEEIARVTIVNDATGTHKIGNYRYQIDERPPFPESRMMLVKAGMGNVRGHRRDRGALALIYQALKDHFGDK